MFKWYRTQNGCRNPGENSFSRYFEGYASLTVTGSGPGYEKLFLSPIALSRVSSDGCTIKNIMTLTKEYFKMLKR